ncbi:MAG: serine/threonine-protein kinase [Pseudomonadales bacterium]|jgi:CHASE2 domain-containing sensor protein|nr:serine/threonine-protein kinase [Pseudomonadales bacterium]
MQNLLKRYDILWTIVIFLLMIPAERYEAFSLLEDEFLGFRQLLRWQFAETPEVTFSSDEIVLVNTDEEFYEDYGGFPLRRADYGLLATNLAKLGARVVAIDALFDYPNSYGEDPRTAELFAEAGNVVLVSKADIDADGRRFIDLTYPIAAFREVATSGYSNIKSQSSLRTRITRLRVFPEITRRPDGWPFAVQVLARWLETEPALEDGMLVLGDLRVPLDRGLDFYIDYPELPAGAKFISDSYGFSAMDVLRLDELRPDEVEDLRLDVEGKMVLIGDTSEAANDIFDTPVDQVYGVEIIADAIHTLLKGVALRPLPGWGEALVGLLFMVAILATSLVRHPGTRVLVTLLAFGAFVLLAVAAYVGKGVVVAMTPNLLLGVIAAVLVNLRYYMATDETLAVAERAGAESNRMLALSLQGQGQLDMAFDKFRAIPLDESVADLVYNLGLDYERKRQFNKAASVYDYLARWNDDYRDVTERSERMKSLDANPMKNAGGGASTMVLDAGEKPMLGRYEVQAELGQGAMGIVYRGEDPKINRVVAIKTMSLAQEFEGDALVEVKERFFREAQSAGRLNHPNIVAIYDAGEEQDLAYIAMEFLKGRDLSAYTRPDTLLPLETVIDLVAQCADALAYAHRQNVVHRDVKPGNIMYDPDSGVVKLTDFGIARITDSSKTRTGTVLGTPNYMSPEQALGDKVDGRSDLFSLGVVLYQLSTGHLPFSADSMATLLYKIVNEQQPDPAEYRRELPASLRKVIQNALGKQPDRRYQTGAKFAEHLRMVLQRMARDETG